MVVTGRTGAEYAGIASEAPWRHIRDRRIDVSSLQKSFDAANWPSLLPGLRVVLVQILARMDDLFNFLPFLVGLLWTAWLFKPELIHANNEPLCNRASILVGKALGIPVICHVRGDQKGSRMMAWMFQLPDYFIPVSRWISESIGRQGISREKRTYIYDGIELEKLDQKADGTAWRAQRGIAQTDFAVGLVGLLIPWKGQHLFLEAMLELVKEIPEMKAVIVGGTPDECVGYERELREFAQQPDLAGHVIFTGHVGNMASAYNGLDVVVSASIEPEPLGTMIIECLTMARPLIAPNHGGAVEMVDNGVTGLLFTPGNANDLKRQIRKIHDDPDLGRKLGQAARTKALATFSVEDHVKHVQDIYIKLLRHTGQTS
jgi:glycosyltransferase involved in cell wall biosynthesis